MRDPEPEADPARDRGRRRRAALVAILQQRAEAILEHVVTETVRATDLQRSFEARPFFFEARLFF